MRSKEELLSFDENKYWEETYGKRATLEVLIDIRDILARKDNVWGFSPTMDSGTCNPTEADTLTCGTSNTTLPSGTTSK